MTSKQVEGSKLKRTFTLPRNPFGTVKSNNNKTKTNDTENKLPNDSTSKDLSKDEGGLERKLFRRPSWKRFINRIAQHMTTVNVSGVKTTPVILNGERVPSAGEPPWPPGTTPAATGIKNHGNTCYMNAVLQCLSHTDIIAEYFVLEHYKVDLQKRNKINSKKYGTKGEVTEQLAALLKALWACRYTPDMSMTFKGAVERHGTQYRGNSQHDAQEFLFWLLDKVHEDLNTATKKKYKTIKNTCGKPDEVVAAETLANHARRNSSFVQTLFQAQYSHDWEAFKVRLTQFCVANGVTDENDKNQRRRRAFLITALTEDTMRVASSLVAPDSLDAVP
ncbi:Ubiquitin carboxyl-terminal hydrolase 31 [Eumeta japonica]|uniref:ubiquitinyl hydrolase 1 n=1 Tax=Eumeta variegata TaxID=151549 RepID=A0A4C1ZPP7_EUMVA|nr:Ubiquitin carboxyl-terminal hydrolase 31 [Eumeta japonica]